MKNYFPPLFHSICLVWAHSKFYCRQTRIIILLQEINNLMIKRGTEFLDPLQLFKHEPEESVEKINICLRTLNAYTNCYESHRVKVKDYFKNGLPSRGWEFTPKLAFNRYDRFVDKIKMIKVKKNLIFNLHQSFSSKKHKSITLNSIETESKLLKKNWFTKIFLQT